MKQPFPSIKRPRKPGPIAFKPTATQRRRVMRGIAIGLTLQQLAEDLGVAYGTMRRVFAAEIKTARVRVRLDTADLLYKAARRGSVSAMKALLQMTDRWRPELDEDDDDASWEAAVPPDLSRNVEIH